MLRATHFMKFLLRENISFFRPIPARYVNPRFLIPVFCVAMICAPRATANWLSSFVAQDIDIVSVTDMTDEGRAYPHASPEKPVYYMIVDAGQRTFGRSW